MLDINDVVTLASSGEVSIAIELQSSSSSTEVSGFNDTYPSGQCQWFKRPTADYIR